MRVLLHDNQLCERGTTTSMLDYGRALRQAGHEVEIAYWSQSPANVPEIVSRVRSEFPLHGHASRNDISSSIGKFDAAYFIKAGGDDGLVLPGVHNLVHAVFQVYEPHGTQYAYISEWIANQVRDQVQANSGLGLDLRERGRRAINTGCLNAMDFDHLDLIVNASSPTPGLRNQFGISDEAFVILRFGAVDTFDIDWVHDALIDELDRNRNWHFVGLNTHRFTDHARAHFIPMVIDPQEKSSIVSMGDVFVTARGQGEAFGVAIAEALQLGLPVLAWKGGHDRAHTEMLDGLDGLYRGPRDLKRRLRRLAKGRDPASPEARRARGDRYRPHAVLPKLEKLLGLEPRSESAPRS